MVNNRGSNALRSVALLLVSSNLVSAAPTFAHRRDTQKPGDKICGPTRFCLGLKPDTCVVLEEGCCITFPGDKTIPTPVCNFEGLSASNGEETTAVNRRKIKGSTIFDAGTSVADAGLTLAGLFAGKPQGPPQPSQKRSAEPTLQGDIDIISEFIKEAGLETREEKRKIKGSSIFDAATSALDAALTFAGLFGGAPQTQKRSAEHTLQDDINVVSEFLKESRLEARKIKGSSIFDAATSALDAGLTFAGLFGKPPPQPAPQPVQKRSAEPTLQDDINVIRKFLKESQLEARKIKGSPIFEAATSAPDAGLTLAGLFGAASQPAQKRSETPSLESIVNFINNALTQDKGGSVDLPKINSVKGDEEVEDVAGNGFQAASVAQRSLEDDMNTISEFLSHAETGSLEARKIPGSAILNSIKNVADVIGLAGNGLQLAGVTPRSLEDDMNTINEFLGQAANNGLEERKIPGSAILNSIKNIADVFSLAGNGLQLAGVARRSLEDDMNTISEFLSQSENGSLEARKIPGSAILNSIKNVADVIGLAGNGLQLAGVTARSPGDSEKHNGADISINEFIAKVNSLVARGAEEKRNPIVIEGLNVDTTGINRIPKLGPGLKLGPTFPLAPGIAIPQFDS